MKVNDFISLATSIATKYKTLYVMGCFGSPMNATNKKRYTNNYEYNKKLSRAKKINSSSVDTFGFDCVNLIKGILWGWNGDITKTYGGAKYNTNGVPDTNAGGLFDKYCSDKSDNFNKIEKGEIVWLKGHVGIYIGDGKVVECTPIWKDGVQITSLSQRKWLKHGKLKFIDYGIISQEKPKLYKKVKPLVGVWSRTSPGILKNNKYKVIPFNTKLEIITENVKYLNKFYWDEVIYKNKKVYVPNKYIK